MALTFDRKSLSGTCHPEYFIADNVSECLIGRNSIGIRHLVVIYDSRDVTALNHDDSLVNDQKKTALWNLRLQPHRSTERGWPLDIVTFISTLQSRPAPLPAEVKIY